MKVPPPSRNPPRKPQIGGPATGVPARSPPAVTQTGLSRPNPAPRVPLKPPARISPRFAVRVSPKPIAGGGAKKATPPAPGPSHNETQAEKDERSKFYDDLTQFLEVAGEQIDMSPKVESRPVDLYDLFLAVAEQKAPIEEVDWQVVAETLQFNWVALPKVPAKLAECYQTNLAAFEEAIAGFEEEEEETGETEDGEMQEAEDGETEEVVVEKEEESQPDFQTPLPRRTGLPSRSGQVQHQSLSPSPRLTVTEPSSTSTSPATRSLKRKLIEERLGPQLPILDTSRKRPRHDRKEEIPSTPDEKLGVTVPSGSKVSASGRGMRLLPSPIPHKRAPILEPETQDFGYEETQVPVLEAQESMYDISPSQQLQSEAGDIKPVQFALDQRSSRQLALTGPPISGASGQPRRSGAEPISATEPEQPSSPRASSRVPKRKLPASFSLASVDFSKSRDRTVSKPGEAKSPGTDSNVKPPPALLDTDDTDQEGISKLEEYVRDFEIHYPREMVIKGICCATGDPGLAGVVMQSLFEGKGIPDRLSGVWTRKDDEALEFMDEQKMQDDGVAPRSMKERLLRTEAKKQWERLVKKHGLERIEDRRKFLANAKAWGVSWY